MGYIYQEHRESIFTEEGQRVFLTVRDRVQNLIQVAGAFQMEKVMSGDTWQTMACVDRMVELGEIVELTKPGECWGQYRTFAQPKRHNR